MAALTARSVTLALHRYQTFQRSLPSVTVRVEDTAAPPFGVNVVTSVSVDPLATRRCALRIVHMSVTPPAFLTPMEVWHAIVVLPPSLPTTDAWPGPVALKVTVAPFWLGLTLSTTRVARGVLGAGAGAPIDAVAVGVCEAGLGTVNDAEAVDAGPVPVPFVAVTLQVYVAPAVSPATAIGDEAPDWLTDVPPVLLVQLALYATIAEPLAFAAVNDTLVLVVPSAGVDAVTADGASGADALP